MHKKSLEAAAHFDSVDAQEMDSQEHEQNTAATKHPNTTRSSHGAKREETSEDETISKNGYTLKVAHGNASKIQQQAVIAHAGIPAAANVFAHSLANYQMPQFNYCS